VDVDLLILDVFGVDVDLLILDVGGEELISR
jgi:hypothetical protein